MASSDRSNKVERVWHDPPMIDDPPVEVAYTLGAGASEEVRDAFNALERAYGKSRMRSNILIASGFTVIFALMMIVPDVTMMEMLTMFITITVLNIIFEVGRYYKMI
jgi:hypothetical protein